MLGFEPVKIYSYWTDAQYNSQYIPGGPVVINAGVQEPLEMTTVEATLSSLACTISNIRVERSTQETAPAPFSKGKITAINAYQNPEVFEVNYSSQ